MQKKGESNLTLFITAHFLLPQFLTIHIRVHLCTHQERTTQFPIERIRLLGRRGETVFEHDGDEGAYGIGDGLFGEWVWALVREGGGDECHGVEMGLNHFLSKKISKRCHEAGDVHHFLPRSSSRDGDSRAASVPYRLSTHCSTIYTNHR